MKLLTNIKGHHNTAVGFSALRSNLSNYNTGIGEDSLFFNTTGDSNTGLGVYSIKNNTTGRGNTGIGVNALAKNTTGYYNVALGENAGISNFGSVGNCDVDDRLVFIGALSGVDKSTNIGPFTNSVALGSSARVNKSNMIKLGNLSMLVVETNGDYEVLNIGKGYVLKSPNGTRYRITVDDTGQLVTSSL